MAADVLGRVLLLGALGTLFGCALPAYETDPSTNCLGYTAQGICLPECSYLPQCGNAPPTGGTGGTGGADGLGECRSPEYNHALNFEEGVLTCKSNRMGLQGAMYTFAS